MRSAFHVTSVDETPVPHFQAATADLVWRAAANALGSEGASVVLGGRDGATKELLHAVLTINDPRQRWIVSRHPAINPAFAIAESLWMVWGRDDEALPTFFSNSYSKFNGPGPRYAGAYGARLRRQLGIDQLERATETLANNTDSRQAVLQIWHASEDLPHADGSPRRADIPCNLLSMLKVRAGKLHWTQVLRSNDVFLGVPYNIVQFTTLQEILAGWLGVEMGPYTHLSDSLHMYVRDESSLQIEDVSPKQNSDSLSLPLPQSREVLSRLEQRVDGLIAPMLNPGVLHELADRNGLPEGYANLLSIMAAESARRRKWHELASEVAGQCSNAVLSQLWERWTARVGSRANVSVHT